MIVAGRLLSGHQVLQILLQILRATAVDRAPGDGAKRHALHRRHNKMRHIIRGQPVLRIRRQKESPGAAERDELRHLSQIRALQPRWEADSLLGRGLLAAAGGRWGSKHHAGDDSAVTAHCQPQDAPSVLEDQAVMPCMLADALLTSARHDAFAQFGENLGRGQVKGAGQIVHIDDEVLTINTNSAGHERHQWPLAAATVAKFVATTCETAISICASSA